MMMMMMLVVVVVMMPIDSVTRMRAEQRRNLGPISDGANRFFASREASTRLMGPSLLLCNGYRRFVPRR
jgi:hypothetical protein